MTLGVSIAISEEGGWTDGRVALAWLAHREALPIIGARTARQFADNVMTTDMELSPQHFGMLSDVSKVGAEKPVR